MYFIEGNVVFYSVRFLRNGFNLWYEENKGSLLEAEFALSNTELIKLAMRKWKLPGDWEKSEWNKKAGDTANRRDDRDELKKRKRNTCEDENEDTSNTLNLAKRKAKEITTVVVFDKHRCLEVVCSIRKCKCTLKIVWGIQFSVWLKYISPCF